MCRHLWVRLILCGVDGLLAFDALAAGIRQGVNLSAEVAGAAASKPVAGLGASAGIPAG